MARQFKITPTTIRVWRAESAEYSAVTAEEKVAIGELIGRYLRAGLSLLEAQAVYANDQTYTRSQDADKLAILHGVVADKLVRILAGLEAGHSDIE